MKIYEKYFRKNSKLFVSRSLPDVRKFCLLFTFWNLHMTRRLGIEFHHIVGASRNARRHFNCAIRWIVKWRNWKPQRIRRGEWRSITRLSDNHEQPWQWKMIFDFLSGLKALKWKIETLKFVQKVSTFSLETKFETSKKIFQIICHKQETVSISRGIPSRTLQLIITREVFQTSNICFCCWLNYSKFTATHKWTRILEWLQLSAS